MYNFKVIDFLNGTYQLQIFDKFCNGYTGLPQNVDLETGEMIERGTGKRGTGSEESQRISFSRTKKQVYAYARTNKWEWFVTLTFSKDNVDRYNYDACVKKLSKWLNNFKSRYSSELRYLIVPERHKDGAIHFHGLLSNTGNMSFIDSGLRDKQGRIIYNIGNYKLGFTTATKITDVKRASSYVCKYITKELAQISTNRKRYWVSRNLNTPTELVFVGNEKTIKDIKMIAYAHSAYMQQKESEWNTVTYVELEEMPEELVNIIAVCESEM